MASDEQRVRTMAGWIGVEISRSRVRTQGKAGYGLYRVRGSVGRAWIETRELKRSAVTPDLHGERGPWTAYAFTLEEIGRAVWTAISVGSPAGPQDLAPRDSLTGETVIVPTRWTSAYTGRRDLGEFQVSRGQHGTVTGLDEPVVVALKPEYVAELDVLVCLLDAGLVEMVHVEGCTCVDPPARMSAACVRATMPERMAQRAGNAAFQAEHLKAREHGLIQRYAAKRARLGGAEHSEVDRGPQRGSQRAGTD